MTNFFFSKRRVRFQSPKFATNEKAFTCVRVPDWTAFFLEKISPYRIAEYTINSEGNILSLNH